MLRFLGFVALWFLAAMCCGLVWLGVTVAIEKARFWYAKRKYAQRHADQIGAWKARHR